MDNKQINKGTTAEYIVSLERKIQAYKKFVENMNMTYGQQKPHRITVCSTFHPKSAMDKDVTLCVDITAELASINES